MRGQFNLNCPLDLPVFSKKHIGTQWKQNGIEGIKTTEYRKSFLSLNTTGAVVACQLLDLSQGDHVVVALDGVLQCGCCNCELDFAGDAGKKGV